MKPRVTRFLQVGDIHLPDWADDSTLVDQKDKAFDEVIVRDLSFDKLSLVLSALNKVSTSGGIDFICFMGDFTTKGNISEIPIATTIFDTLVNDQSLPGRATVYGVPGNHDVSKIDARNHGPIIKFMPLVEAFQSVGWNEPPIEDCVISNIMKGESSSPKLILVNTSLGSMSTHMLPEHLRSAFADAKLDDVPLDLIGIETDARAAPAYETQQHVARNRVEQWYQQLDTPYISRQSVTTLLNTLTDSDSNFAIVCAHHNILPQRIPRISAYAEMLNAGLLRRSLLSSRKHILYLHGHIHEDPVETISITHPHGSEAPGSSIVSVSAPPIWDGFNEIACFHDSTGDVFLVRITEYRPDENGHIGNFSDQRSRYFPLVLNHAALFDKRTRAIFDVIRDQRHVTWPELLTLCYRSAPSENDLEFAIMTLFCCNVVSVKNLGRERRKWRISLSGGLYSGA